MFNLRLLFVAIVWGINFSVVKFAIADFHPLGFAVIRFSVAALFLAAVMLAGREDLTIDRGDVLAVVKLGLAGITIYNIFFMEGLKYTTAANSALLISLSPLFGAVITAATGRERLTMRIASGLCLAAAGVVLIVRSNSGGLRFSTSGAAGDVLTLCAALSWAFYTIWAKPLLNKYSPVKITAYAMAAGSLLLLPFSLPELTSQDWRAVPIRSWSALVFAAFVAGGIAYVFWYGGVKQIGIMRTMVYHYLMPFAAVLFASWFLGEHLTVPQVTGGLAILGGVYLVQRKTGNREIGKAGG